MNLRARIERNRLRRSATIRHFAGVVDSLREATDDGWSTYRICQHFQIDAPTARKMREQRCG